MVVEETKETNLKNLLLMSSNKVAVTSLAKPIIVNFGTSIELLFIIALQQNLHDVDFIINF